MIHVLAIWQIMDINSAFTTTRFLTDDFSASFELSDTWESIATREGTITSSDIEIKVIAIAVISVVFAIII